MLDDYIFVRTSTIEQTPALQINDIVQSFRLTEYKVLEEQDSAFKNTAKRPEFERLKNLISSNKVGSVYVWDLDRLYRNRKRLVEFLDFCKAYRTKVYSHNQIWLTTLQQIQPPFNEIMYNFMLEIMAWLAEDESAKKSKRVKLAIRKTQNGTESYKGNKWGRKSLSKQVITKVKVLHAEGMSIRQIAAQVKVYDKNNNSRQISKSAVHKIITML
jgi:DNA invertase Pin-like site-specific DNA recombinase